MFVITRMYESLTIKFQQTIIVDSISLIPKLIIIKFNYNQISYVTYMQLLTKNSTNKITLHNF